MVRGMPRRNPPAVGRHAEWFHKRLERGLLLWVNRNREEERTVAMTLAAHPAQRIHAMIWQFETRFYRGGIYSGPSS